MNIPWQDVRYACTDCGALHMDQFDAERCCENGAQPTYLCPVCQDEAANEEAALDCCVYRTHQDRHREPTPKELEDMGQMRLIPKEESNGRA